MIRAGIVCGCLPTQAGIAEKDLYHQILAQNIFENTSRQLVISSVWYSTLSETKAKILALIKTNNPSIILYHVRPDPYLRISKLLIRYRDLSGRFHLIVNMKADDEMIIEKNFEPHGSLPLRKRSMFKVISRGLNDMAGILLTVNRRAIEREKKLLKEIVTLCKERDIHLIIIGPASRPRSKVENYLLNRLEVKLASEFKNEIQNYITCFGKRGSNNENLFLEDGVHVSKEGHKRIADFITPVMLKFI